MNENAPYESPSAVLSASIGVTYGTVSIGPSRKAIVAAEKRFSPLSIPFPAGENLCIDPFGIQRFLIGRDRTW